MKLNKLHAIYTKCKNGWCFFLYIQHFILSVFPSYLLSLGADPELENDCAEKPADLIEPDNKELLELFGLLAVNDWELLP